MQPTNAAPFNPLDFKKLSQQEQFEAARTMNQKELIAVAGTGVPLEILLKYQGLSDAQIQKRLAEFNPYLACLSSLHQPEQSRTHKAERSHAEFYAMLEEQSHASAATQAGHKLGNITNLSHDQQIHALADHFSHGGSIADAAKAYGATDAEAQETEDLIKEKKAELTEKYKNEKQTPELAKKINKELSQFVRESESIPPMMRDPLATVIDRGQAGHSLDVAKDTALRKAEKLNSQAKEEANSARINVINGTVNAEEKNTLKNVDLSEKSTAKIQSELKHDKALKTEIIRNFVKDDVSAANKVAAATIYAKGGISKDSVSDVKREEREASKSASAEVLKTGTSTLKTNDEWSEPDIPKVGSIKVASWQKKNAEAKAPASGQPSKLTA